MPYVTKGKDYSLWKTLAITKIVPLRSSWRQLVYIQSRLILSEHFPLCLGCSPLIFHHWKPSLVGISGINMGSTSNISRVCGFGIVDWFSSLRLDLVMVNKDQTDEFLQLLIRISILI